MGAGGGGVAPSSYGVGQTLLSAAMNSLADRSVCATSSCNLSYTPEGTWRLQEGRRVWYCTDDDFDCTARPLRRLCGKPICLLSFFAELTIQSNEEQM